MTTDQRRGLTFGSAAAEYDRYRPTYPPEAIRWALGEKPLAVVDLGAGTGALTRALVRLGHRVIPVEPDARMRAQLSARDPSVEPLAGTAEAIPLEDGAVDAVTAGQAYHWFDPAKAHAEIARVLRPGGVVAPLWNIRDESVPWVAALSRAADDVAERSNDHLQHIDFGAAFGPAERREFHHSRTMTADSLAAMMRTRSYYLAAAQEQRAEIEAAVRRVAADLPATFDLPYRTVTFRAYRRATA